MVEEGAVSTRYGAYRITNAPIEEQADSSGVFIYVLLLNVSESAPHHPFYVGQATNPRRRFGNHQVISWHHMKFEREVHVWIIGKVPAHQASEAEHDLIQRLAHDGYWLANSQGRDLIQQSRDDVLAYAEALPGTTLALEQWQAKWAQPEFSGSRLQEDDASENLLTRQNLIHVIDSMRGQLKGKGQGAWKVYDVWMKTARVYEEDSATASLVLSAKEAALLTDGSTGGRFQLVWQPQGKIHPGPNTFALRRSFKATFTERLAKVRENQRVQAERAAAIKAKKERFEGVPLPAKRPTTNSKARIKKNPAPMKHAGTAASQRYITPATQQQDQPTQ